MDVALKRQQAAEEARAALEEAVGTVDEPEQVDEPEKVDEPQDITPDVTDTQSNPEVDRLLAEVSRLTARLEDENSPTYKSRWDALKGQFNARGTEIETLTAKIANLEQRIAEKPAETPPAQMEDDPEYAVLVEEVGVPAAKIIYRQNQELKALQGKLGGVDEELKATKGKTEKIEGETSTIKERQASTDAEQQMALRAQAVPDWELLMGTPDKEYSNQHPKFTEYLQITSKGKSNFQLLNEANNAGNIAAIKEIFDEGRQYSGVKTTPKPSSKADKFIEPGKTGQGTQEPTGQSEMIPESEIKALSTAIRMQTFKGTKAELEALKEKHRKARIEGRVIEGR